MYGPKARARNVGDGKNSMKVPQQQQKESEGKTRSHGQSKKVQDKCRHVLTAGRTRAFMSDFVKRKRV
jgi:hypothetical protein